MNEETSKLISLIESWEKGYLPPSAQLVFSESRKMIVSNSAQIEELKLLVEELEKIIEELKNSGASKEVPKENKKRKNKNEG